MVSNSFNLFESVKDVLVNMLSILMMPAKLGTLAFLKIKILWNKGLEVLHFVHYKISTNFYHVKQIIVTLAFLWE